MMRFVLTPLTLLAVCGSLVVAAAVASPSASSAAHASAAAARRARLAVHALAGT